MTAHLYGTKPLPEPMQTYNQLKPSLFAFLHTVIVFHVPIFNGSVGCLEMPIHRSNGTPTLRQKTLLNFYVCSCESYF